MSGRSDAASAPGDIGRARRLATQIEGLCLAAIRPIEQRMRTLGAPPELEAIMWEALARMALDRANLCSQLGYKPSAGGGPRGRE